MSTILRVGVGRLWAFPVPVYVSLVHPPGTILGHSVPWRCGWLVRYQQPRFVAGCYSVHNHEPMALGKGMLYPTDRIRVHTYFRALDEPLPYSDFFLIEGVTNNQALRNFGTLLPGALNLTGPFLDALLATTPTYHLDGGTLERR